MAEFQQFELIERFTRSNFEKLPGSLRFDRSIKEEGKLYRLLTGSVDIKNNINEEIISQTNNYSILGKKEITRLTKSMFVEHMEVRTSLDEVHNYLRRGTASNIPLFRDLTNEFCLYFHYTKLGIHTLAFLHIYRVLERISYTFPMLYASKTTDYVGTFGKLQAYFKSATNELKFFNLFIEEFFITELREYPVKFNITAFNEEIQEKYFKIIRRLCINSDPPIEIKDFNEFTDITIENRNTLTLMIHIRNRYFHFASGGQRNIDSNDLIEPNDFFNILNCKLPLFSGHSKV